MYNPIEERRRMVQERIAKSFTSGINMAEEMNLEKAWNVGDEKQYQGVTYYVGGFNAKGQPLWRKKKDGGGSDKKHQETNGKKDGEGEKKTIDDHASRASTDALKHAAADENAKPEVREAAKKELEKRNDSAKQKKNDKASSSTVVGGKVDISKIPDAEFKRITQTLEKKNPDHTDAPRHLEEEEMSDKELKNFYAVAEHFKNSSKINKLTQEHCRKWAELARQEMQYRKKDGEGEKKELEKRNDGTEQKNDKVPSSTAVSGKKSSDDTASTNSFKTNNKPGFESVGDTQKMSLNDLINVSSSYLDVKPFKGFFHSIGSDGESVFAVKSFDERGKELWVIGYTGDYDEDYTQTARNDRQALSKYKAMVEGFKEMSDEFEDNELQHTKSDIKLKSAKQVYDEDFNDDLNYVLSNHTVFGAPKEVGGIKVGSVNDKGEIWIPTHNKDEGKWVSKEEIEERANNHRSVRGNHKLTSEQKKNFPIGAKYKDKKGREFTVVKHDSYSGKIKLVHKTDDGKKKVVYLTGQALKGGLNPNFTTGFPEIDKKLR